MENKYLNEENYKKGKAYLKVVAFVIILVGVSAGVFLISKGVSKSKEVDSTYSEENKQAKIDELNAQVKAETAKLEEKKQELVAKGVEKKSHARYDEGEVYDLYVITKALDPSFDNCAFDEYKNNALTSKYCNLKNELEDTKDMDVESLKNHYKFDSTGYYMTGTFIIIASCMICGVILYAAHGREIAAFHTQQVMPVAKEGISEMAPTIGKAGASIAKEMAPVYGEIAKEIGKGIKEGLGSDNTSNNEENK